MVQPRYIVLVLKNIPVGYDLRWKYQPELGTCLGPQVLPREHMTYSSTNARCTLYRAKLSLEPNTNKVLKNTQYQVYTCPCIKV